MLSLDGNYAQKADIFPCRSSGLLTFKYEFIATR
jgi:hypothetical protein